MKHQPYLHLIIVILSLGGLISGIFAWIFLPDILIAELRSYAAEQIQNIASSLELPQCIKTIFSANALDLLHIYLYGMCLIGLPMLFFFLFIKCFSIGFSCCILLRQSIILCFTRILYVPVLCAAVVLGCRLTLQMIQKQIDSPIRQFMQYTFLFAGLLLCVLLVSSLDGLSSYYYATRQ